MLREDDNTIRISRKAHLICLLTSAVLYSILATLIFRFNIFPDDEILISAGDQLPYTYVDGNIRFSPGGRHSGARISVIQPGGEVLNFICRGVNMEKHPNAIPCFKEAFQKINGKPGRVWYMEREFTSKVWGTYRKRMAVQLQADPDIFFSFDDEKPAIMGSQSGKDHNISHWIVLLVLKALLHACGFFLVLLVAWTIADKLANSSRPEQDF